jgi:phage terminase large subunit
MPEDYKWRVFGMDFGYTNDPTTLIEIRYHADGLYWKEHLYKTGMTNPEIAKEVKRLELQREKIVADSAEPKSIEEIKRAGCYIVGAEKGKDSINQGIDAIKRYNVYIEPRSKNLIEEFSSYTWDKDRDGNPTNKPIDAFNHGIDGGRYALSKKILTPQLGYS